jgi:Cys-rich repeat protein
VEGFCNCAGADDIRCSDQLCCDPDTEICRAEKVGDALVFSCQAGSCPATDFCTNRQTEQFVCANDPQRGCVCTSTTDPIPGQVCVDFRAFAENNPCDECATSSQCGSGRVCIAGGDGCVCGTNFCVPLCPEFTGNSARRGTPGDP